jgi:flagellar protein FliS
MAETKIQEYLLVQVRTATQDQLLLLLLDGAVRFVEGARERMAQGERERKGELLLKAQNIVLELIQSLSPSIGEKIYSNLIGLYKFIVRRLVEANARNEPQALEEGLQILKEVRQTWREAVAVYRAELSGRAPAAAPAPGLSVQA